MSTPLHESLIELADVAPTCGSPATAKGVIAESHELMRKALAHRDDPATLVHWYSAVVRDVLASPAVTELTGGTNLVPTGALGREEALPGDPIQWLTPGPDAETLSPVGLCGRAVAANQISLIDASQHSPDGHDLALLRRAVSHRPAGLNSVDGLPDHSELAEVRKRLLVPVADVARWAAGAEVATLRRTPDRLAAGVTAGVLTEDERADLQQAWHTALGLSLRRWVNRVSDSGPLSELEGLDRSAYGESARTIGAVIRALATRNDIDLSELPDGDTEEEYY